MTIIELIIYSFVIYGWAALLQQKARIYYRVSYVAACAWIILVLFIAAYF